MEKITVIPHLSFNGQCEEAVNAYIRAFGGEIHYLSRWTEQTATHSQQAGKVMHVAFSVGVTPMAGSDNFLFRQESADAVRLMIHMDDMEKAKRAIAVLAEGGEVLSPLKPHPVPDDAGCGSVTRDRFGYVWIITCPNPDKQ
ncbi:MAG: VOC family protein [Clostridia bacterium]|nr:VOC family protein [Clostridia bacterium]